MKINVQRTPDTRAPAATEGYAQGGAALDLSPITDVAKTFATEIDRERKNLEEFDLNSRLVEETNQLHTDFVTRKQSAPLGAAGFAEQVDTDYEARHDALVEEYWQKGYSQDALNNFSLRLDALRQNFGERSLAFQADSVMSLANQEMTTFTTRLSQFATTNPDGYGSAKAELQNGWAVFPGLTEQQRATGFERDMAVIRQGAAKGLALQNPGLIIDALDPHGLTAPMPAATATGGAYENVRGWQGVATNVASQLGLNADEVAAVMSFETGGTFDPKKRGGDGGNYMGLIQFGPEERRTYGIDENSTPEQWTSAILGFMGDRGFRQGMGLEDFYSTILTGSPGHYDRTDSNGTSVRNAIPRILAEHRENAAEWLSSGIQTIDPGAPTGDIAPALDTLMPTGADGTPDAFDPTTAQTGNPILDDLNGSERLQALAWAREQQNKTNTSIKASMDVTIQNAVASVTTGEYAGPMLTHDQVVQVYGPVEGEQKWSQFEGSLQAGQVVQRVKTLSPPEIQREIARLAPDPASETYARDLALYNAAQTAQATIMTQREADPAAYVYSAFPEIATAVSSAETPEQRRAAYARVERAFDQLGTPENQRFLMTEDMLRQVGQQYKSASPQNKVALLEGHLADMGAAAGRTLGRFGGEDVAGDFALYSTLRRLPNYRDTLGRVFEGRDIMRTDPARRPPADVMSAEFRTNVGNAINNLSPDMSRMLREATAALYVESDGYVENGQLDNDKFTAALRVALGGSATNPNTGIVKYPGASDWTILPPGITSTQFENWVDGLTNNDLIRLSGGHRPVDRSMRPLPLYSIVDEGTFVMVSPGVYGIRLNSDNRVVGDETGHPFTMNITLRTAR